MTASEQEDDQEWFLPLVFNSFCTFPVRWQACLYLYNLFPHPFPCLPNKEQNKQTKPKRNWTDVLKICEWKWDRVGANDNKSSSWHKNEQAQEHSWLSPCWSQEPRLKQGGSRVLLGYKELSKTWPWKEKQASGQGHCAALEIWGGYSTWGVISSQTRHSGTQACVHYCRGCQSPSTGPSSGGSSPDHPQAHPTRLPHPTLWLRKKNPRCLFAIWFIFIL